ncbi:hypothetical protein L0F63_002230 [Massospora cicadina]|nr:hypothetical protein L0F63_002230 [Massospora cicadina]
MNAAELLKFSREEFVGVVHLADGSIQEVVGHFEMDDVDLIYLNLSPASPRRNSERYMSFTALLDQTVPTGPLKTNDLSPFSNISSLSSPTTILEEAEPEVSLEELDTDTPRGTETKEPISTALSIVQSEPSPSPTDVSHHALLETNLDESETFPADVSIITDSSKAQDTEDIEENSEPNMESEIVDLVRTVPGISLTMVESQGSTPGSTITLEESHVIEPTPKKEQRGMFSSIRRIKKKAQEIATSAKIDPAIAWLPSSRKEAAFSSINAGTASSASLKKFYEEAHSHGQSMVVDEFGFIVGMSDESDDSRSILSSVSSSNSNPAGNKSERALKFDLTKEAKWRTIMGHWSSTRARKSYRVKKLVESGIPDLIRGRVWEFLANSLGARRPGTYKELLARDKVPIYDVIERDIKRTYPKHSMFYYDNSQGQIELHAVLKAYAQYNPEVGYCQGMGLEAEEAFWLLIATINQYLQGYFTPTLSRLRVHAAVFGRLLEEHDSRLSKHLAANDISPLLYVTPWFLTVFTMSLPWASVLRVWDLFYYKGELVAYDFSSCLVGVKILFRVGLAIMSCVKSHILKNCPGPAELLPFLLHIPHSFLEPAPLMAAYKKVRITTSHIRSLCRKVSPDGMVAERGDLQVGK